MLKELIFFNILKCAKLEIRLIKTQFIADLLHVSRVHSAQQRVLHHLLQVLKKEKKVSSICPLLMSGILGDTRRGTLRFFCRVLFSGDALGRRYSLLLLYLGELGVGAVQLLPQRLVHSALLPLQQQRRATQIYLVEVGPLLLPLPL